MAKKKASPTLAAETNRPELRALLTACKADLDDDTPRSVLADWLEEHGDESDRVRAELIRLQLDLPRFTLNGEPTFQRYVALCQRNNKCWLGPAEFLCAARDVRHERGLLVLDVQPRQFLTQHAGSLAGTEAYAWVEELIFRGLHARDARDIADSPLLASVPRLVVTGRNMGDEGIRRLASSTGLGHLTGLAWTWADATLSPAQVRELGSSPHLGRLRWLDLSHNNSLTPAFVPILAAAPAFRGLTRLYLSRTPLGPPGLKALLTGLRWRPLRWLDLRNANIDSTADLSGLADLPELRGL